MKVFKTKSFNPNISEEQLERGAKVTSFLSFERAIKDSEENNRTNRKVLGYQVTEEGIILILE
jgi:hypothetical protein